MSTLGGERSTQPKRSRIVVNIDDLPPRQQGRVPRGAGPSRRRNVWRVMLFMFLIGAALFCVALAGLYLWAQSRHATPTYALALAIDAAQRGDVQAFDALVDIDSVTRGMVPQVIEKATGRGSTLGLPAPARRFIATNAAVLLPGSREMIRDSMMEEIKNVSEGSGAATYPFFIKALALSYLADSVATDASGNAATIIFKSNERPIGLQLRRSDERGNTDWKIVDVKSDELAMRVAQEFTRNLPPLQGR